MSQSYNLPSPITNASDLKHYKNALERLEDTYPKGCSYVISDERVESLKFLVFNLFECAERGICPSSPTIVDSDPEEHQHDGRPDDISSKAQFTKILSILVGFQDDFAEVKRKLSDLETSKTIWQSRMGRVDGDIDGSKRGLKRDSDPSPNFRNTRGNLSHQSKRKRAN
ncbi:hypothetical protein PSPO01_14868 [Paraphaeosphaeria sporulosa]